MRRFLWLLPLLWVTQAHAQVVSLSQLNPAGPVLATDTAFWCQFTGTGCDNNPAHPLVRVTAQQIGTYVVGLMSGTPPISIVNGVGSLAIDSTLSIVGGQLHVVSGGGGSGVTSITCGTGLTGGTITTTGTCAMPNVGPNSSFTNANITLDAQGRVTAASNGTGGGGGTPGGANGQAQFNNAGAFGGSTGLTMNTTKIISMSMGLGSDATGDIYYNSGSTTARLGIGTAGQVLAVSSGLPAWQTVATGGGTVGSGTGPQIAQYPSGASTVVGGVTVSGDATLAAGGALTISPQAVTNAKMLQMAANTVKGNFTGSPATPTDNAMPACADTAGNHLNYASGTGITCGTSSSGGGGGTAVQSSGVFGGAVNAYTMASPTPAISANTAGYRVCGFFPSSLAANTGAATFAAGTAAALPIKVKSAASGVIALSGGEILPGTNGNPICVQLDNTAASWVLDSQAPGSLLDVAAGTTTVTQASWAAQNVYTARVAGTTITLPASAGLSSQAGITVIVGNGVTAQLCATGSDTINGGAAAGCVTMGYGGLFAVSMPAAGAFFVPLSPDKKRPSLAWAPGMNLSGVSVPMFHIDNNSTAVTAMCRVETAVGGTATVQLFAAANSQACGSGAHLVVASPCNANGSAAVEQSLTLDTTAISAPADICAVFPTNTAWSTSTGAGFIQINLTTP